MIPSHLLSEVITVTNRVQNGPPDEYGTPTWVDSAPIQIPANVQPQTATENESMRDTRIQIYTVYVNGDAAINGLSEFTWRGKSMSVIGEPKVWANLDGSGLHHYELEAEEILG